MTISKPRPTLQPGENRTYPVLPLRDIVVFPHMIVPLFVGREKSIKALEEVMRSDTFILLATQKNASDDDPSTDSIFETGTLASVLQLLKLPDGTVKVLVEGATRARVLKYTDRADYYEADATVIVDDIGERVEAEAMARSVVTEFEGYVKLNKKVSPEVVGVVQQIDDYAKLADTVASHLAVKIAEKQLVLETPSVPQRLEKVKERIVEYLAVQQRANKLTGPILCLVGPPGVGKTSLGKSIAKATGREFVRVSLGGVRDEAEIRGHRRTYIGSMPGKIIQSMRKAKSSNPLFLLDEVDKMGADFRGDPSSALLEVLDPEQNHTFNDHYLEVDYDLSNVMFITTANTLNIPAPLMDRMEIIRLAGYTEEEKVEIARRHLIPNAISKHGLNSKEWSINDEALLTLIRRYTREAGVRNLEREISTLVRKAVKELTLEKSKSILIDAKKLEAYLGVPKYRYGEIEADDLVGVVTGLAWTDVGGELLTIEGVMMPGKGRMTVTGNLRDVMKESISAAASYVRSRAITFGIEPPMFDKRDIHVHVPEGATPKDGPSAGVAMVTSIVSTMTGIPVRKDVAMTGEITLRGRVLPIGGLKEKLLAAHRGGIKTVLIPEENAKDLTEISDSIKGGLEIIPVSRMDEVLKVALTRMPEPIQWDETAKPVTTSVDAVVEEDGSGLTAH
jgi:ATP-dependent Lon protease